MHIICIGDSHIPKRAKNIPEKISQKIDIIAQEEQIDYIFFTGDVVEFPEFIDYLRLKAKRDFFIVMGNMDYYYGNRTAPMYQSLDLTFENNEKITIGLTHGAQISPRGDHSQLESLAIERNYNILISGHTHKEEIFLSDKGILLINPGSVTGAWSFVASQIPSFIEMFIIESIREIIVNLIQVNKQSREILASKSVFSFQDRQIKRKY
ncbi:MAG: YfcE family phosphodiesterase [Promethearchaeota archaeon]